MRRFCGKRETAKRREREREIIFTELHGKEQNHFIGRWYITSSYYLDWNPNHTHIVEIGKATRHREKELKRTRTPARHYMMSVSAGMHFGGPQMGFENVHIGAKWDGGKWCRVEIGVDIYHRQRCLLDALSIGRYCWWKMDSAGIFLSIIICCLCPIDMSREP